MVNGITPPIIAGPPIRIGPPVALPVSLAEIRAQLNMTADDPVDQDAVIMGYVRAATEYCQSHAALSFITQEWSQTFSGFPTQMILRRRPLQAVTGIEYLDGDGESLLLDTSIYQVSGIGSAFSSDPWPTIRLASGQRWPTVKSSMNAITVTYTAGFGDDHNSVPEVVRLAIMQLVSYWYGQRETAGFQSAGRGAVAEVPFGTHALLHDYRPLAVA